MKVLIYTDNHFCQNSSIIRGRGKIYSDRLENQIKTINWIEKTACDNNCALIINAGDFFDSSTLNSEEISALREIKWNQTAWHYFLVGNHDASNRALTFSSTNLFSLCPNSDVIDRVSVVGDDTFAILFVPYISQTNMDDDIHIDELITDSSVLSSKNVLMISHNDIKDVQFGGFVSKSGLLIDDIEAHCDLCVNGHLHNGEWVTKKILNLGNITGQNFSEDAFRYKHQCIIVDTDNMQYKFVENPFAFNFYKIDITSSKEPTLFCFSKNAIVTVKCDKESVSVIKEKLGKSENVKYYRVITTSSECEHDRLDGLETLSINHIEKFKAFIENAVGTGDDVMEELCIICEDGV